MAKQQYTYQTRYIAATPRNKRLTDSIQAAAQTGGGGGSIGYPSTPQYWELVTSSADGNPLEESQYYLRPISGKHVVVPGDVVAFADGGEYASGLPVADFDTFGLFKAKRDGGLLFSDTEGWYIDPNFIGGGGIDEKQLEEYLTKNQYVNVEYLTKNGYLTLKSTLTGYSIADKYEPISPADTILSAIGKLERNFDNYVDLTTNQTIGGVKTFNENVLSKKDVIAFADGGAYASGLPVADTVTYGLVKIDGTTIRINADGQLEADAGGGIDFTVGAGLQLSTSSVLSVKFGTTPDTACRGNDSRLSDDRPNPYYLSWSGYSNGSYDGSESKSISIPNNTDQLTNGAGFIKDGNENFTTLQGSGDSSQYLAGNGRFYTISHNEISGLDSNYVTLSTTQTITGQKSYTALGWYKGIGILKAGPSSNVHIVFGAGSGNVINGLTSSEDIGNLYFNYQGGTAFTRVDANNNLITTGDVAAFSDGGSFASGLPVADQYTYGLMKYDNVTIKKNSNGQLYAVNSGGGGGSDVSWGAETQYHTAPLTVNGVSKVVTLTGHTHEWSAITNKPGWIGSSKPKYSWSEITNKPGWIGSSKPSYSWSEITNKPSILSSITYSTSGSGNAVINVTASGNTVYVTKGNISGGGGNWDGGTVYNDITIYKSYPTLRLNYSGFVWAMQVQGSDTLNFSNSSVSNCAVVSTDGTWTKKSDIRLKKVIRPFDNILEKVSSLSVFYYNLIGAGNDVKIGVSAQQVRMFFPEFVRELGYNYSLQDNELGVDYSTIGAAISIQGVKELYTRFKPVENKVKVLENKVQNLQQRLDNAYREIFELKKGGAA